MAAPCLQDVNYNSYDLTQEIKRKLVDELNNRSVDSIIKIFAQWVESNLILIQAATMVVLIQDVLNIKLILSLFVFASYLLLNKGSSVKSKSTSINLPAVVPVKVAGNAFNGKIPNPIRQKAEKRLLKEKVQLILKFTKRRTLRIKNSKKRQLQHIVDKNSMYAVNQLTQQESDYEAQSIYETGNQSQLQISVAKPQPKRQSPNFPGFGNGNQDDGLRLSLQDSVECDMTPDQVIDELQKASSTPGAECIGAYQGCAMSSIDDREEAITRFFQEIYVDNTKLKLTDYLTNTKTIYHLLNIRSLDTIRDTIIFTDGVNETSSNVINMIETDGFVSNTETTVLAADDLKSVTTNTFKKINAALKPYLFTQAEHKKRTIQPIFNSFKKTSKKDVHSSKVFSTLSAHLSNGKRMPFRVKSLNRTRECIAICTKPYENASDDVRMDPDIPPKLLKPRWDKEHYFETDIISKDSIQYVKKRRRGYGKKKSDMNEAVHAYQIQKMVTVSSESRNPIVYYNFKQTSGGMKEGLEINVFERFLPKFSDMNEAVHAYQRQKMVTVSSESRNPIVYDNLIQTSGGMEERLEINVFERFLDVFNESMHVNQTQMMLTFSSKRGILKVFNNCIVITRRTEKELGIIVLERSFRVVEHRVLFDSKINDASELVRYQLNLSLRKVRESDPNKKSPTMYVYDPKIFEDALREIGIGVSEKSQDEDLIRYELYFPSGCRMVIAVPVNVPNKDKMNIEKGF